MSNAYVLAQNQEEAVTLLCAGDGLVMAGGTDLMLDLRQGKKHCGTIVDITAIPQCTTIDMGNSMLRVGACCTFRQLEEHPLVREYAPALAYSAACVGSPQIRNVGTPGGNVVNAMPAADAALALTALGATVEIVGVNGRRMIPIEECYGGIGRSTVDSTKEFIVAFYIPAGEQWRSCYKRFALRESLALPAAAVAVGLRCRNGVICESRVVLGPAGNAPWHAVEAQNYLAGKTMSVETAKEASHIASEAAPFRDSPVRCSAAYKKLLAESMVKETLLACCGMEE